MCTALLMEGNPNQEITVLIMLGSQGRDDFSECRCFMEKEAVHDHSGWTNSMKMLIRLQVNLMQ